MHSETIKQLEENMGSTLQFIGIGNDLEKSPNAQATKAKRKKLDYIKLRNFCTAKQMINKVKKQSTENPCALHNQYGTDV